MKRCPVCSAKYPDDANFCPMDAGRLVPDAGSPAEGAAPASGSPSLNLLGGRFALGAALGGHRTGEVVKARDQQSGAECAVKIVARAVIPTSAVVQRTERELKQLQKVVAQGAVRILESGRQDQRLWVAMELVNGTTLAELVARSGPLAIPRALKLALEIGEVLADAAKQGVIHRDVAPKNVFIADNGRVKVTNFALPVPTTDRVFGVPEFLSPEQAEGKQVDQRSNIYGLGALLYLLVTGGPPFAGVDAQAIIHQVLQTAPIAPSQRPGLQIPADVERLILKALEKNSARRHLTLRQMLSEIETFLGGVSGTAATAPPQPSPAAANPVVVGGNAGMTIIGGFGALPPEVSVAASAQAAGPVAAPVAPAQMDPTPRAERKRSLTPPAGQAGAGQSAAKPRAASPTGPASGKSKGRSGAGAAPKKGGFRETMWFKKGELDAEAALAAAAAPQSPDALPVSDKADELPLEDRYKDDGTLTQADRERLSLRTGQTQMMQAVKLPSTVPGEKISEADLVNEMKAGRWKILLVVLLTLGLVGGLAGWYFTKGGSETRPASAGDAGTT